MLRCIYMPFQMTVMDRLSHASEKELYQLAANRMKLGKYSWKGEYDKEAGMAYTTLARSSATDDALQDAVQQASYYLQKGLDQMPLDPYGWGRLMASEIVRQQRVSPRSAQFLILSMMTGGYEPSLLYYHLENAMLHWELLGNEGKALANQQLCTALAQNSVKVRWRFTEDKAKARVCKALSQCDAALKINKDDYRLKRYCAEAKR